ncbi:hypothetical protein BDV12DRAFT_67262 [Aspergillus spectabilis]
MLSIILSAAFLAIVNTVSAHGYVSSINIAGTDYPGFIVEQDAWGTLPELIAWSTTATDTGFVEDIHSPDIICHEGAQPGALSAPIAAGEIVKLQWSALWPADHWGPVITYLANCNGDCSTVDKTTLRFFKIDEVGLLEDGTWGSAQLAASGKSWEVIIPNNLKAGNYVLRHEIIALHSQFNPQPYPQCVNLEVIKGGKQAPEGVLGTELYQSNEPGLYINIWSMDTASGYKIPGPMLYSDVEDTPGDEETTTSITMTATTFVTCASSPLTENTIDTLVAQPPQSTTYGPGPTSTVSETEIESATVVEMTTTAAGVAAAASQPTDSLAGDYFTLKLDTVEYSCVRV